MAEAAGTLLEIDRRRIESALRERVRYRYVRPKVLRDEDAWRIVSPCCSRNIDPTGGIIDVALLRFDPPEWRLYARDHAARKWIEAERSPRIRDLLDAVCLDPQRVFWP